MNWLIDKHISADGWHEPRTDNRFWAQFRSALNGSQMCFQKRLFPGFVGPHGLLKQTHVSWGATVCDVLWGNSNMQHRDFSGRAWAVSVGVWSVILTRSLESFWNSAQMRPDLIEPIWCGAKGPHVLPIYNMARLSEVNMSSFGLWVDEILHHFIKGHATSSTHPAPLLSPLSMLFLGLGDLDGCRIVRTLCACVFFFRGQSMLKRGARGLYCVRLVHEFVHPDGGSSRMATRINSSRCPARPAFKWIIVNSLRMVAYVCVISKILKVV